MQASVAIYNTHFNDKLFLEERNNTWNTPFLFNGKELKIDYMPSVINQVFPSLGEILVTSK